MDIFSIVMGCIWSAYLCYVVDRVGSLLRRYEVDRSFAGIDDDDLVYFPKLYLMYCVECLQLEFIWHRLPKRYQEDIDLIRCRPCLGHSVVEGDTIDGFIRRKDCYMCRYTSGI